MTTLDKRGVRRETNTLEPTHGRKRLIVLLEVGGRLLRISSSSRKFIAERLAGRSAWCREIFEVAADEIRFLQHRKDDRHGE